VNGVLTLTIIASISAAVLETVDSLAPYYLLFAWTEYTAVTIFIIEYLLRIKLTKKPLGYIFSYFGIIDLLAILPTLLGLADFTFLKIVRIIRMLRLLRMTHVAKFTDTKHGRSDVDSLFLFHLEMLGVACIGTLLTLGTAFYIFEDNQVPNIPLGMWWVMRIVSGTNVLQPETVEGTVTLVATQAIAAGIFGILVLLTVLILRKRLQKNT
jgi:voltage-gated potassium channel